ncbi:hypothetical protein AB0F25_04625 [Streptomyces wedmorensis]|uniref:hypothetical protein n=1 Tax=Streptomyces wedmorensis TaxID=43759 RepID=UPI0034486820
MPGPTAEPAAPPGRRARPDRAGHRLIALLLVLAALCGAGATAGLPAVELRAAAASPAPDPGGETHDPAGADAGLTGRTRRHRTGLRPARSGRGPHGAPVRRRTPAPVLVPAPRGDALRRVVMRC